MRAIITIDFEKILFFTVNEELLQKEPKLFDSTQDTVKLVCKNLEKYFKDHKIKVKTKFTMEK